MTMGVAAAALRDLDMLSRAGLGFEEFAVQMSDTLRRAVPFEGICVGLVDPSTNMLTRSMKIDLGPVGDSTFLFWEYAQDDVAHFSELATRDIGISVLEDETGGDKNMSGRFREVVSAEIGAEHELRGVTRVGGHMWGTYAMYREAGVPFNAAEADFLQRLEATVATGLRSSTIVAVATEAATRDVRSGPAVLVFAPSGSLIHATSTAAERLDDLGGAMDGQLPVPVISIVAAIGGTPATEAPPAQRTGGSLRGATVSTPLGSRGGSAQIRARGRSGRWYTLHAAPFASDGSQHPNIAVTVEEATPPQILPLLTAAYGLTSREASIVQAMLRGESTHAIAQSLFLSPYTVQDHFKSIFEKIGVSSRREVATRVFYGHYLGIAAPT
jgi:DNA-binding CsgD family transcriptional regulator